jgi:hypothetical protein
MITLKEAKVGCDIHGVWECKLPNGDWVAFKHINDERSYEWFGILSGVRRHGPRCNSIEWDPRREPAADVGAYWKDICVKWGRDFHRHTLVSILALRQASDEYKRSAETDDEPGDDGTIEDHEPEPSLDDIVENIIVGFGGFDDDGFARARELTMGIPLRDVMMLGPEVTIDDVIDRIRMVVAYDN